MSLYSNEPLEFYDPMTGEVTVSAAEASRDAEVEAILAAGDQLETLKGQAGWQLMEDFIKANIEKYREELIDTTDMPKIARLQAAIKSYRNILALIEGAIFEAKTLKQQQTPAKG